MALLLQPSRHKTKIFIVFLQGYILASNDLKSDLTKNSVYNTIGRDRDGLSKVVASSVHTVPFSWLTGQPEMNKS